MNPQASSHLVRSERERLATANAYTNTKCVHNDIDKVCKDAGIDYQPVVLETFGGVGAEGMKSLNSLNRLVANRTHTPYAAVARRFWQGLSMQLQPANHRAFVRRAGDAPYADLPCVAALRANEGLEPVSPEGWADTDVLCCVVLQLLICPGGLLVQGASQLNAVSG